jgi:hypothetical protein
MILYTLTTGPVSLLPNGPTVLPTPFPILLKSNSPAPTELYETS